MKSFETTTKLMPHQKEAIAKLLPTRVGALFMDMGTGKTRTAIELVKLRQKKISKVLWFCPVSLKETIRQEILKHTTCSAEDIYTFGDKTASNAIPNATWYIIGLESISQSDRVALAAHSLFDSDTFVVVDESSYIKGHRAKRTERLTQYARGCKYRLIMTGTPITQGIQDLYAQMKFLSPKILGYNSFYSFAANHLEYHKKRRGLIVRAHNEAYIAARIRPYVYQVTKEECLTLPSKLYDVRYFYMTEQQREAYEEAKLEFLSKLEYDSEWSAIDIFQLFTSLQSIVCGFWNRNGQMCSIPHRRLERLLEVVRDIPEEEKIVVWAKYQFSIREIAKALRAKYGARAVAEFHGENERSRDNELARFKHDAKTKFLVATQSCGGYGLTLTEARYAIFYADSFKYGDRLQAEDRCHRIGQTNPVTYISLYCLHSIDERIEKALDKKGDALAAFREEVEKVKQTNKTKIRELVMAL
jgi:SNF2 family DNA or RNA helicase